MGMGVRDDGAGEPDAELAVAVPVRRQQLLRNGKHRGRTGPHLGRVRVLQKVGLPARCPW